MPADLETRLAELGELWRTELRHVDVDEVVARTSSASPTRPDGAVVDLRVPELQRYPRRRWVLAAAALVVVTGASLSLFVRDRPALLPTDGSDSASSAVTVQHSADPLLAALAARMTRNGFQGVPLPDDVDAGLDPLEPQVPGVSPEYQTRAAGTSLLADFYRQHMVDAGWTIAMDTTGPVPGPVGPGKNAKLAWTGRFCRVTGDASSPDWWSLSVRDSAPGQYRSIQVSTVPPDGVPCPASESQARAVAVADLTARMTRSSGVFDIPMPVDALTTQVNTTGPGTQEYFSPRRASTVH